MKGHAPAGLLIVLILALAACAPQPTPSGPGAEEVEAMIATSVAQTIVSYTQTQAAAIPPTATETATPTVTLSPFPSLTPFPTSTPIPLGGGIPVTVAVPYACSVINKTPFDNAVFKRNEDFDVKFWLMNIGSREWNKGLDLHYESGADLLTAHTIYELPEVKPGQMMGPYIFDARTPRKPGTYTMTFKLQGGFCYPYIKIVVR